MRGRLSCVAIVALLLLVTACGSPRPLTVFAAASLTDVMGALGSAYRDATGTTIQATFDASSALRTQIEGGAPADLFLSADEANVDRLVTAALARDKAIIARNSLAIVARKGGPVADWTDLTADGVRVAAAGPDVPITHYATDLVAALAAAPGAPSGFAAGYAANVATEEDNVRAELAKVQAGEADAAIVYATDAASAGAEVATVALPDGVAVAAQLAGAVISSSDAATAAGAFLRWITGPDAGAIWERYAFVRP